VRGVSDAGARVGPPVPSCLRGEWNLALTGWAYRWLWAENSHKHAPQAGNLAVEALTEERFKGFEARLDGSVSGKSAAMASVVFRPFPVMQTTVGLVGTYAALRDELGGDAGGDAASGSPQRCLRFPPAA